MSVKFETVNELALQVTITGHDYIYTKAGAFVSGMSIGQKNYQFEKVLLGPQGNPVAALAGQLMRRVTKENLPLMKVTGNGESITYYANKAQHVVCFKLDPGETISVESENILAFTKDCKYGVRFLAQGVISQKGLATSTLTAKGPEAYVAILCDGNPLTHTNIQNHATIEVDPDAVICWIGSDPTFKLDLSWKNFIGQASGETYMFEWGPDRPAKVLLQPNERDGSGISVSMDGGSAGAQADRQNNPTMHSTVDSLGSTLGAAGAALGAGASALGGGGTTPTGGTGAASAIGSLLSGLGL